MILSGSIGLTNPLYSPRKVAWSEKPRLGLFLQQIKGPSCEACEAYEGLKDERQNMQGDHAD